MLRLGIENISVFGLPPVEFVSLAADLGCQHISTGLTSFGYNPHNYPVFSLRDDASLRREMIAAMADRGISISLGEGLTIREDINVANYSGDLDIFSELGVERVNTVSMDTDQGRSFDEFAVLAQMAAERNMELTLELVPGFTVADLPTALSALAHVDRPNFRILIDTMHLVRSGSGPSDIAALDPNLIGYVQLCDAPLKPRFESYFEESMFERMVPGEGELVLRELVAVLPVDRVYSVEIPLRSEAEAGLGPRERLEKCVLGARRLLTDAHGEASTGIVKSKY